MPTLSAMDQQLETARLRLRPWQMSDAASVRRLWAERDRRSLNVIDADGNPTVDHLRTELEKQLAQSATSGLALLAVERRTEGDMIGYCGLIVGRATWEEPEIAYELVGHAHGQGYATEAAQAVVEAATSMGRTRLWATVRDWNTASFRVLEKLGFVRTDKVSADPERGDLIWTTCRLKPDPS